MNVRLPAESIKSCPVCGGSGKPMLTLRGQPIYQHPVPLDIEIPAPYKVDLSWSTCTECAHAWQPDFDDALLERIYRSHYYTPAPDGIALTFRNEFFVELEKFGLLSPRDVLLEIGASDGDVLSELKVRTGARRAYAFEPNVENAEIAKQRGLDVKECFFGQDVAGQNLEPADMIYARHVIEHVFDFDDFFSGVNVVATQTADLILETPSLDFHAAQRSTAPFHIEHVHVFSLRSLARLASIHGWVLIRAGVTTDGNLIAAFRQIAVSNREGTDVAWPAIDGMQQAVTDQKEQLRRRLVDCDPLIIWGAGSAGVNLVSTIGREPDYWTDGNPNKIGKKFVGLTTKIVDPKFAFSEVQFGEIDDSALVIASSFLGEILPHVRQLGWKGEVLDSCGNRH